MEKQIIDNLINHKITRYNNLGDYILIEVDYDNPISIKINKNNIIEIIHKITEDNKNNDIIKFNLQVLCRLL